MPGCVGEISIVLYIYIYYIYNIYILYYNNYQYILVSIIIYYNYI